MLKLLKIISSSATSSPVSERDEGRIFEIDRLLSGYMATLVSEHICPVSRSLITDTAGADQEHRYERRDYHQAIQTSHQSPMTRKHRQKSDIKDNPEADKARIRIIQSIYTELSRKALINTKPIDQVFEETFGTASAISFEDLVTNMKSRSELTGTFKSQFLELEFEFPIESIRPLFDHLPATLPSRDEILNYIRIITAKSGSEMSSQELIFTLLKLMSPYADDDTLPRLPWTEIPAITDLDNPIEDLRETLLTMAAHISPIEEAENTAALQTQAAIIMALIAISPEAEPGFEFARDQRLSKSNIALGLHYGLDQLGNLDMAKVTRFSTLIHQLATEFSPNTDGQAVELLQDLTSNYALIWMTHLKDADTTTPSYRSITENIIGTLEKLLDHWPQESLKEMTDQLLTLKLADEDIRDRWMQLLRDFACRGDGDIFMTAEGQAILKPYFAEEVYHESLADILFHALQYKSVNLDAGETLSFPMVNEIKALLDSHDLDAVVVAMTYFDLVEIICDEHQISHPLPDIRHKLFVSALTHLKRFYAYPANQDESMHDSEYPEYTTDNPRTPIKLIEVSLKFIFDGIDSNQLTVAQLEEVKHNILLFMIHKEDRIPLFDGLNGLETEVTTPSSRSLAHQIVSAFMAPQNGPEGPQTEAGSPPAEPDINTTTNTQLDLEQSTRSPEKKRQKRRSPQKPASTQAPLGRGTKRESEDGPTNPTALKRQRPNPEETPTTPHRPARGAVPQFNPDPPPE